MDWFWALFTVTGSSRDVGRNNLNFFFFEKSAKPLVKNKPFLSVFQKSFPWEILLLRFYMTKNSSDYLEQIALAIRKFVFQSQNTSRHTTWFSLGTKSISSPQRIKTPDKLNIHSKQPINLLVRNLVSKSYPSVETLNT